MTQVDFARGRGFLGERDADFGALSIVEALGDIVWVRDARSFELLYVSKNAQAFLGLERGMPFTSETIVAAVHPEDRPRVLAVPEGASDHYAVDFRFYRHGELRWAHTRARIVSEASGAPVRIEGCTSDVTERKRREAALLGQSTRAETLSRVAERLGSLTRLDDAMRMVCEETALALAASTTTVYLYEPASGELLHKYAHGLASDGELFTVPYEQIVQGVREHGRVGQIVDVDAIRGLANEPEMRARKVRSFAFAAIARGDEVLGMLSVVSYERPRELRVEELALLKGIADQAVGPLVNARLFAEKELAEARLRVSEMRYRQIVETTQEGIAVLSKVGTVVFCNERLGEIFGVSAASMVGKSYSEILVSDDPVLTRERLAQRMAGASEKREVKLRTREGRDVWLSVSATPVSGHGEDALLLVVSDITASKRLADKLQSAQKAESLGVLAGGVAHDFNNLLVSILGNAGFALMTIAPESEMRDVVLDIQTAAVRASELTRQLLAYSGRGRFVITHIDLGRVVAEMAHLLASVIPKTVTVHYELAPELPLIEGDATQIRQIVMNLITNASDAIENRSGTITVRTTTIEADRAYLNDTYLDDDLPAGSYVCLEVTDTGAGMTKEVLSKIFEPFFSTKFTGRGLGLAAALGILRAHRAAIDVRSEPGRGTTFKVLFPVEHRASEAPPIHAVTDHDLDRDLDLDHDLDLGRTTVLVVDDDASVRAVVERILVAQGATVLHATDGEHALAIYAAHRAEVGAVILDLMMPNMGGEETFRKLRQLDPGVRVLLASGYSEQEATSRFAGEGLAGFIGKPFTPKDLLAHLRAVLKR